MKLKPVQEQVIVITGASSGIGLVTARMAARNEDALHQLAKEIQQSGGKAIAVAADVGQEADVNRIAMKV